MNLNYHILTVNYKTLIKNKSTSKSNAMVKHCRSKEIQMLIQCYYK